MSSLLDLIAQREAAAATAADHLREQITKLSAELAAAETELAELAITRKTVITLTGQTDAQTPADTTVGGVAYQQILAVFVAANPMRAKDICLALGLGTAAKDTEGIRAKLKRLVARQILIETEPGLFTLAAAPTA